MEVLTKEQTDAVRSGFKSNFAVQNKAAIEALRKLKVGESLKLDATEISLSHHAGMAGRVNQLFKNHGIPGHFSGRSLNNGKQVLIMRDS